MITVYYLTRDTGDGGCVVDFFRSFELCEKLIEEREEYMLNEDIASFEVPDTGNIKFSDKYYA